MMQCPSKNPYVQKIFKITECKINIAEKCLSPLVLLAIRIHVGLVFWRSGQTKIDNLDNTKQLFSWEYIPNWEKHATQSILGMDMTFPVPSADFAAISATYAEIIFPVLLIAGFGGRFAAFGLFMMALTIETFIYPGSVEHAYWMLTMAVIITQGPGIISADYWIRRKMLNECANICDKEDR